jgi:hypothetical protein
MRATRKQRLAGATGATTVGVVALAAVLIALGASCSSSSSDTGQSTAAVAGSNFESDDGNLLVGTGGNTDWENAPNRTETEDILDPKADNSFGRGTKEDDPQVHIGAGSIPPNKSDLSRFYTSHEIAANGHVYLYLAWERTNVLGSANMDFELNQAPQPFDSSTTGAVTMVRTPGDLLITFDFVNGGGTPVLHLLRWVGSGPSDQCHAANATPCWGIAGATQPNDTWINLSDAGEADGAVNAGPVDDPITVGDQENIRSLEANTFGEAGIDLTAAGVFPLVPTECLSFASAFLKSRASASFTSEVKDFIAPAPIEIGNCVKILIHKKDDLGAPLAGATFVMYVDKDPKSGDCGGDDTLTSYTCTSAADGSCEIPGVLIGDYCIHESVVPPYHDPAPDQHVSPTVADVTVELQLVDPRQPGAIVVTKTGKDKRCLGAGNPDASCQGAGVRYLSGVTFQANGETKVTGADGTVCFGDLVLGQSYQVTELATLTGYAIDTTSKSATPTASATCSNTTNAAPLAFNDTPLSRITVLFESLAGAGVTAATIECTGDSAAAALPEGTPPSGGKVLDTLIPGTYTCTVVVDP